MSEPENTKIAREEAAHNLAKASAELIRAAESIAEKHGVPSGINGLAGGEFLGRISFVVSMQRELKRAGENLIAQELLREQLRAVAPQVQTLDTEPPYKAPPAPRPATEVALATHATIDVGELPGITAQVVKALKQAGIHTVEDVGKFTDEALLKVRGIAPPTLGKLRASVAQYESGIVLNV